MKDIHDPTKAETRTTVLKLAFENIFAYIVALKSK